MLFVDVANSMETIDHDRSKQNHLEAMTTVGFVKLLAQSVGNAGLASIANMIGVISPYKSQVRLLKNRFGGICRN